MFTKRNSGLLRKNRLSAQKSAQNDAMRLYFTFFSHIPLALSVKKCYTDRKIIYNILYNRIVLFWRLPFRANKLGFSLTQTDKHGRTPKDPTVRFYLLTF